MIPPTAPRYNVLGVGVSALTLDAYDVRVEDAGSAYYRTHIFRSDLDYRYKGVLHESLVSSGSRTAGRLDSLLYRRLGGGGRSRDPEKFRKERHGGKSRVELRMR